MIPGLNDLHVMLAAAPVAAVLALREIRSRRRYEADLREREEQARRLREESMRAMQEAHAAAAAARKSREEFLSRMNHELRTPLNAVIGFSRTLEKNQAGNQRPADLHLLGRVRAGGEQLLRLVEDVLDQSSIDQGQLSLALGHTDVATVTARVVESYRVAAAVKGVTLVGILPRHAPAIALDPTRFEQVVQNLVDNAIKFTTSGTIRVALITRQGDWMPDRLVVSDTGVGIASDRIRTIFEPFEQVDTSPRRSYGGAGLGLPLARKLCIAMGCTLEVESQPGVGTTFTIAFPGCARDAFPDVKTERLQTASSVRY